MITLYILFTACFFISIYKVYKKSGSWEKWNPFDASFICYFGVIFGGIVWLTGSIWLCIKYLP